MFPKLTHITPILPILPILAALTIGALGAEKLGDMNWFYFGPVPEGRQWCQLLTPEKAASSGSGSGRLDSNSNLKTHYKPTPSAKGNTSIADCHKLINELLDSDPINRQTTHHGYPDTRIMARFMEPLLAYDGGPPGCHVAVRPEHEIYKEWHVGLEDLRLAVIHAINSWTARGLVDNKTQTVAQEYSQMDGFFDCNRGPWWRSVNESERRTEPAYRVRWRVTSHYQGRACYWGDACWPEEQRPRG